MTKRPTFFLSSTIYDFRDLRGAIKFTLESRGCRVLASEYNDFGSDLDRHSYDACLANIEQSDYFVLLIGGRVGGWYDEPQRVSITQQEYRTAYERHKQGLIRIVTFVRDEVWQLREDRKALRQHLATMDMTDRERREIQNFPSKFATDAEFVGKFLTEVGRNLETGRAVQAGTPKPTGNWIHAFRDFRDVHDVLHPLTFAGRTADEAAYAQALQHELLTVLGRLLVKGNGKVGDMRRRLKEHLDSCPIGRAAKLEEEFAIDAEKWQAFSTIMIHMLGGQLNMVVIEDALTSSLFLAYVPDRGAYVQSPAYDALSRLVEEIRLFNKAATVEGLSIIFRFSPRQIGRPKGMIYLPTQELAVLHGLAHRWINIVSLSIALILYLDGRPFVMPDLMPFSPIKGMDDEISKENVTASEARSALGL